MKIFLKLLLYISLFVLLNFSYAFVIKVPDDFRVIQLAIDASNDGDTVSVWTEPSGPIPRTYVENIAFNGKNILVVNRSYIEDIPNYPPDPSYIVIDGNMIGVVVKFNQGETQDAILKGFTIQNGASPSGHNGAGIHCNQTSPRIENNIIQNNGNKAPPLLGGGIAIMGNIENFDLTQPIISNNIIRNNYAHSGGGGIHYEYAHPIIINNNIVNNHSGYGSGIFCYHDYGGVETTLITGNKIDSNALGALDFFGNSNAKLRNNSICHNLPDPNFTAISCGGNVSNPDFGDVEVTGPGYNWIEDNGPYYNIRAGYDVKAEGNYWATLHTPDINSRINGPVDFDPIAASDRVASVSYNSECSTDVIVTGDLTVNQDVTLNIASGKTFKFSTTADTNTGNYNSCELLVNGSLQANGTENERINFTSNAIQPLPGDWYGIILRPDNSTGDFNYCNINNAYCGIYAAANNRLSVDNSFIESNQVYGIKIVWTQDVEIRESEINGNIYGIFSQLASPVISNNRLLNSTRYGIFMADIDNASVTNNYIDGNSPGGSEPTLYGMLLGRVHAEASIDGNRIEQWSQGGVWIRNESETQMNSDTILKNTYYGILCSYSSSPKVRRCQIESNKSGVHCEEYSYPDLGNEEIEDIGYNSIDTSNVYWVANCNPNRKSL